MNLNFGLIRPDLPYIFQGTIVTLEFTLLSAFFGLILGSLLSLLKLSRFWLIEWLAKFYTSVFRGTPLLVQLSIIYLATPQLTGYNITALQAGVLTFSLNSAAYVSETIRGGILAVDKGQREASLSLGIPYGRMMGNIIMPQAIRNILPALMNEVIALLKDSALVSTIGVGDLLRRADVITGERYIYFEPYITVAAIYYAIVMIMTWLGRILERRLRRSD